MAYDNGHEPGKTRLASLDALRGLMLMIVLLDHCAGVLPKVGIIRRWTLMGLGFSDAADWFVFISGLTFGWVYSIRIQRDGIASALWKGLGRTLQIYFAYLLVVLTVGVMGQVPLGWSWDSSFGEMAGRMQNALWLSYQPYAVGILSLYIVCLPVALIGMIVSWRMPLLLLLISYCTYSLVQIHPAINLPTTHGKWSFNPFAWQLLMILGLTLGRWLREDTERIQRNRHLFLCSAILMTLGLLSMKRSLFLDESLGKWVTIFDADVWTGKANLGLLRLLHFLASAYFVFYLAPVSSALWRCSGLRILRSCGRYSLTIYSVGVVAAHSFLFLQDCLPISLVASFGLVVFACCIQLLIGAVLARRLTVTCLP